MIGAGKLNFISKFTSTAVAEVIRKKRGIISVNGAALSTTQSKFGGSSAFFDGTNDYLSVPFIDYVDDFVGDFTIEGWFYSTGSGTNGDGIFSNDNGSLGSYRFAVYYEPGNTRIGWFLGDSNVIYSNTTMNVNTWYHIAFVRSGSTTKLYVNGTAQTNTSSSTHFLGYSSLWKIGMTAGSYFQGYLDEIRWSKTARYTTNFTAPTAPFVNDDNTLLLIHADGTNASTYFEDDNGVRAQKGIVAVGNAKISTTRVKFGGSSAYFDGAGDYLLVKEDISFPNGNDFTLEFWVNEDIIQNCKYIGGQATNDIFVGHDTSVASNRLGVGLVGVGWYADFGVTLAADTWYHVAISRSGTTVRYFIDGDLKLTQTSGTLTTANWKWSGLVIGAETTGNTPFNGYIDEVRFSNTARYTSNFTAPTAPFVNDDNTLLLIHADGTDASTYFEDDNGVRAQKGIVAVGNAQIDTAQSKFGGSSALFDGTGDYLKVEPGSFPFTSDFTIEFWVRLNTKANQLFFNIYNGGTYVSHIGFESNNGYGFLMNSTNWVLDANAGGLGYSATNTGQWYHIAVTRETNTFRFFVDGILRESSSSVPNLTHTTTVIGAEVGGANSTNGWMDEIRVSNTARYTANFTAPTVPFQNDSNTLLLIHADGTDASTVFFDDNGKTPS